MDFNPDIKIFNFKFDESNPNWSSNRDHNELFIRCQVAYFEHRLTAKKVLFLNEVLDALGIDRIPEGQLVGWHKDGNGVDIMWDIDTFRLRMVVDGPILDKL